MAQRQTYSRDTRLKVQRLYLGKSMQSREIAAELGLPLQQVYNIVHRYGLAETRAKNEKRSLTRAEDQAQTDAAEFLESITPQAMEEAEGGFAMSRAARRQGDAKGFAMAAKGTQIFVQIARQGLGLDASGSAAAGRTSAVAFVYARFPECSEKRAEPVEVEASSVSEDVILEFESSQLAENPSAESAALIGNPAQLVVSPCE